MISTNCSARSRPRFRRRFSLGDRESDYLRQRGLAPVLEHAVDFIAKRLAPAHPRNDGRQTPWRNHPVFVAQHATATCCRRCLERWHRMPRNIALSDEEQRYVVAVLERWLRDQAVTAQPVQSSLLLH